MIYEDLKEKVTREGWKWLQLRKSGTTLKGYGQKKIPVNWPEIEKLLARHGPGVYEINVKELLSSQARTLQLEVKEPITPTISDNRPEMIYTPEIIESLKELERKKVQLEQERAQNEAQKTLISKLNAKIEEQDIQLSQETELPLEDEEPTTWEIIAASLVPVVIDAAPNLLSALGDRLRGESKKSNLNNPPQNESPRYEKPFSPSNENQNDEGQNHGRSYEDFE